MIKKTLLIITVILFLYDFSYSDQLKRCKIQNAEEMKTRFIDNQDGTVSDMQLNVMWQKCSFGQEYKNGKCIGEPIMLDWYELKKTLSHAKWRLPTIEELSSIISPNCVFPAINSEAFPNSMCNFYWSKTGRNIDDKLDSIYGVLFLYGDVALSKPNLKRCIRFLKSYKK